MPYVPDATVVTEPVDGQKASTAALEFRTLKAYIQTTVIGALIAGKIGTGAPATISALYTFTANEAIRFANSNGFLGFYNTANTVRSGYLQGNTTSLALYADLDIPIIVGVNGVARWTFGPAANGTYGFYPNANGVSDLGLAGNRIHEVWANIANFTGDVTAATFHGDGAGLTNLPSAPVSSVAGRTGAVVLGSSDVGLAAVENKNSATIRSEITAGNVIGGLGYTPVNAGLFCAFSAVNSAANGAGAAEATTYTEILDTAAAFNPATGRFTAPTNGYYHFDFVVEGAITVATAGIANLRVNGNALTDSAQASTANDAAGGQNTATLPKTGAGWIFQLTAGDYVSVYTNAIGAGTFVQAFSGHRLTST